MATGYLLLSMLLLCCSVAHDAATATSNVGWFAHLTDFHIDLNYSEYGDPKRYCHVTNGKKSEDIGQYGNYMCDSSLKLVNSSIWAVKEIEPGLDFIVWTGDSTPHIPNRDYNMEAVAINIQTVTNIFLDVFGDTTKVFAVLGNHDWNPANQLVSNTSALYQNVSVQWLPWLGYMQTLADHGYYSASLNDKLTIIGLNTNLYYSYNDVTASEADPGNQFQWLEEQLLNCSRSHKRAIVIGHIAPGAFERSFNITWLRPQFNSRFLQILQKHSSVIGAMLFGHDHTDSFRLVTNDDGMLLNIVLLAPAVTPWFSTLPGAGANNPGIRLLQYDRKLGHILNYKQYYLNLTAANAAFKQPPKWELLYDFQSDLGNHSDRISPTILQDLVRQMKVNDTLFQKYYKFNSIGYDRRVCSGICRKNQFCAIEHLNYTTFYECLVSKGGSLVNGGAVSVAVFLFALCVSLFGQY